MPSALSIQAPKNIMAQVTGNRARLFLSLGISRKMAPKPIRIRALHIQGTIMLWPCRPNSRYCIWDR